jgi:hypothetical protein
MPYTLWHRGILIGETDFEEENSESIPDGGVRHHLAGAFRPTAYGRRLLPRMCGMLTAASELKKEMNRRGLTADDAPPQVIEELFETTAASAHIIDIGRVLCDVVLRAPGGRPLEVASMAFAELAELESLSSRLGRSAVMHADGAPPDVPEFLISVTLRQPALYS